MAHPRWEMLRQVRHDKRLSDGAKILYEELDDCAGKDGRTWISQKILADRLGKSLRRLAAHTDELRQAGYLKTERRQRASAISFLPWFDVPKTTHQEVNLDVPKIAHQEILDMPKTPIRCDENGTSKPSAPLYDPQQEPPTQTQASVRLSDEGFQHFTASYLATGANVIEEDFEDAFRFVWSKLTFAEQMERMAALTSHARFWDEPRFIPRPRKFLETEWKREAVDRRPVSRSKTLDGFRALISERLANGDPPW